MGKKRRNIVEIAIGKGTQHDHQAFYALRDALRVNMKIQEYFKNIVLLALFD